MRCRCGPKNAKKIKNKNEKIKGNSLGTMGQGPGLMQLWGRPKPRRRFDPWPRNFHVPRVLPNKKSQEVNPPHSPPLWMGAGPEFSPHWREGFEVQRRGQTGAGSSRLPEPGVWTCLGGAASEGQGWNRAPAVPLLPGKPALGTSPLPTASRACSCGHPNPCPTCGSACFPGPSI